MKTSTIFLLALVAGLAVVLTAGPVYPEPPGPPAAPVLPVPKDDPIIALSGDVVRLQQTVNQLQQSIDKLAGKNDATQSSLGEVIDQVRRLQTSLEGSLQRMNDAMMSAVTANATRNATDMRDLTASVKTLRDTMGETIGDLQKRVEGLSNEVKAVRTTVEPVETAKQLLDAASLDLYQGHWDLAIEQYKELLAKYPNDRWAPEAQLKIGDALFSQNKFDQAILAYDTVWQKYTDPDRSRAALYKKGLAQEKTNDKPGAIQSFQKIVTEYKDSQEATLAAERLKVLRPAAPRPARGQ